MPLTSYGLLGLLLALLVAGGLANHYHNALKMTEAQYEAFQAEVKATGEAAKAKELEKEKIRANAIQKAAFERDTAVADLRRLRDETTRSRSYVVPPSAAAAKDGSRVCFDFKAFDAAIRKFDQDVSGIAAAGDEARLNARALIEGWPK